VGAKGGWRGRRNLAEVVGNDFQARI
jgi:hypothetical protein